MSYCQTAWWCTTLWAFFLFTVSTELEDVSSPLSLTKLLHIYGQGNWNKENNKMHMKESLHQKSYDYQVWFHGQQLTHLRLTGELGHEQVLFFKVPKPQNHIVICVGWCIECGGRYGGLQSQTKWHITNEIPILWNKHNNFIS